MVNTLIQAITILILPTAVFLVGGWIMTEASDRHQVRQVLANAQDADRKPLNRRLGYSAEEVDRHWGPIARNDTAYKAEQLFLELDLIFPFLYGAALVSSLLMAWAYLERPFSPLWAIVPVVIIMLADWTENLIQLARLRHYAADGLPAIQTSWIHLASGATIIKLLFFYGTMLFITVLVVIMLRTLRPG